MATLTQALADAVSVTDLGDTVTLSDVETRIVDFVRTATDTVTLTSDEVGGLVHTLGLTDSVTLADARTRAIGKLLADGITLSSFVDTGEEFDALLDLYEPVTRGLQDV